jgi:septal ring factor EnvC (AmiA/AmiB activator)
MTSESENTITLGELVRSVGSLVAQVSKLSDKLDDHRDDIARRFDDLGDRYVRKEIHIRDIGELHGRQDNYQKQTDVLIDGLEQEQRKNLSATEKVAADLNAAIAAARARDEAAAAQRHQDRITVSLAFLAAVVAIVAAILPGLLS